MRDECAGDSAAEDRDIAREIGLQTRIGRDQSVGDGPERVAGLEIHAERLLRCGVDELREQAARLGVVVGERFGMPLHADEVRAVAALDAFDQSHRARPPSRPDRRPAVSTP